MSDQWVPSAHGSEQGALQGRVTRGLGWTFLDQWGRQFLNLLVFIVIARLIQPEDVGVVALATVFVAFAQVFIDSGMGDALVQRPVVTRAHIDTAFWISLATGVALAVITILLAIPVGALFDQPRVTPILQVLSLSFVLEAASSVQMSLLRRELALRSLAVRALVAVGGGATVGISLAYLGFGPWALVGQQLTIGALSVLTVWRVSPWRPGPHVSREHFRELFSFGINIVGADILNFLSRRTDNLLVGAFIGTAALGFYTVAYRILDSTQALLGGIAVRIAYPAFSRLQHDRERLRNAFLRVNRVTSAFVMPGFIGLSLVAPELIVVLFGKRWTDAGPVAAVLFLVGVVWSSGNFGSAALNAAGHPEISFRFRLISTITNVAGFIVAALVFGTTIAVATAFVVRGYLLLPLQLYWLRRYVDVSIRRYFIELRGVAIATIAMATAVVGLKTWLSNAVHPIGLLAAEVAVGGLVFTVVFWLLDRRLMREILDLTLATLPGRRRARRQQAAIDLGIEADEVTESADLATAGTSDRGLDDG